ncbi:N-acetylmuramoyl-L-alanine amidase [Actinopolyspora erythraea]|uniref:N-acetylmuramoyl-L-alanine amidase n=1 Tax=Actinopolyspora erythraea TaxID=414996 RepID=A0A223RRL8_9ACTN|nr:peptidoglycan recognition family protein [Actinopolyspora erythraea]ASU78490.1 N-acetylmuramoyl-L-alanine amidase [Actinopolyspora erythraea]
MTKPPSPPYIPAKYQGGSQNELKRIVLHSTVSDTYEGAAEDIARYFQDPTYESSAHYAVDPGGAVQMVYDHTIAWHDGVNRSSIGVEMCEKPSQDVSRWESGNHPDLLSETASIVRQLCLAYGIPIRRLTADQIRRGEKGICGHDDMAEAFPEKTNHWDPGAFPWDRFLAMTRNEIEGEGMATPEEIARAVWDYQFGVWPQMEGMEEKMPAWRQLHQARGFSHMGHEKVANLQKDVSQLLKDSGVSNGNIDLDELANRIVDVLAERINQ